MSKPKFTPGPWHTRAPFRYVGSDDDALVAETLSADGPAHRAANAHLIAAAPEMFRALQVFANIAADRPLRDALLAAVRPHERDSLLGALAASRVVVAQARGEVTP